MITDRLKFTDNDHNTGCSVSVFTIGIRSKSLGLINPLDCSTRNLWKTSDDVWCPVFDKQNMQHYELLVNFWWRSVSGIR